MPVATFQAVSPAVFYVEERPDGSTEPIGSLIIGTAFVIDASAGLLATAAHVVEGTNHRDLRVRTVYGRSGGYALGIPQKALSVYVDPTYDLAVLNVHPRNTSGRSIFAPGVASVGSQVVIPGYAYGTELVWIDDILGPGAPKSISPVQSHGHIAARIPDDGVQPVLAYAYDATTYPGQSGSPVLDIATRSLVAVHTHGFDGTMGYGIAVDLLLDLVAQITTTGSGVQPLADPTVLLDVPLSASPAPDPRQPEKDLKVGGKKWRILRNDPDPLPSNPHAHLLGSRRKLHLGTGDLYERSVIVGRIGRAELMDIRAAAEAAEIALPAVTI